MHRLVAAAFIGPAPSSKHVADHIFPKKTLNLCWNLQWVLRSENNQKSNKRFDLPTRDPSVRYDIDSGRFLTFPRDVDGVTLFRSFSSLPEAADNFKSIEAAYEASVKKSLTSQMNGVEEIFIKDVKSLNQEIDDDKLFLPIWDDFFGETEHKITKRKKTSDEKWNRNFEKLKRFKHEHGHCTVPYSYLDYSLYVFVCRQRKFWKLKQIQRQHFLSDERKNKLLQLGFVFDLKEHRWNTMFNKLVEHKRRYKTLLVPRHVNMQLYKWVVSQQKAYRFKNTGKGRRRELSQERIDCLLAIDFEFQPSKKWDVQILRDNVQQVTLGSKKVKR